MEPTPENPIVPDGPVIRDWECPLCGTANRDEIHTAPAKVTCAGCKERFGYKMTLDWIQ